MNARAGERGSALMMAVIVATIATAIAVALLVEMTWRVKEESSTKLRQKALGVARAGLEKARRELFLYRTSNAWNPTLAADVAQWNSILAYNQTPSSGRVFSDDKSQIAANFNALFVSTAFSAYRSNPDAPGAATSASSEAPPQTSPNVIFGQNRPFDGGGYHVWVRDNDDGDGNLLTDSDRRLMVLVTGTLPDGTQARIEALITLVELPWTPGAALVGGGNIILEASTGLQGTLGGVEAAGNLSISGSVTTSGSASAAGTVTVTGSPAIAGGIFSSATLPPVPNISTATFAAQRTHRLGSDGLVYSYDPLTATETLIGSGSGAGWFGLVYFSPLDMTGAGAGWAQESNTTPPPGVYLVQGSLKLASQTAAWSATLLVTGSASLQGNPFVNYALPNIAIIADKDIKIEGNPEPSLPALYYAREQMYFEGNPVLYGAFVAANLADTSGYVTSGGSNPTPVPGAPAIYSGNGNPNITYNGFTVNIPIPGLCAVDSLREIP